MSSFTYKKPRALLSTAAVLLASILLASHTSATGHFNNKNRNYNNAEGYEEDDALFQFHGRNQREVRGSPFVVTESRGLNNALAILESECQGFQHNEFDERQGKGGGKDGGGSSLWVGGSNNNEKENKKNRESVHGEIRVEAPGTYQLDREFIFTDRCSLRLVGTPGVVIEAAQSRRHFTFENRATLWASDVSFENGGNEREGFYGGSILFIGESSGRFQAVDFR